MNKKRTTRSDALLLSQAAAMKAAIQLLTPLALVRLLDQSEFGEYRLFWLVANTATLLLPLGMGHSLLFFLPRASEAERIVFVSQTLFYFLAVSILASIALLFAHHWLPASVANLTDPGWTLAAFTLLWVFSTPVRLLPNADQDIVCQSRIIILLAVTRALIVIVAAWIYKDVHAVFLSLLGWASLQFAIMGYYVFTRYGFHIPMPTIRGLVSQLKYAVPFGVSQTLTGGRRQIEQWLVALLFAPASLAIFSVGASFNVVLRLVQGSMGNVILPKISKAYKPGNAERALQLNSRGNVAVFFALAPVIVWLWATADSIVGFLYTESYTDAVPIMRVYLITLVIMSVEPGTLMMVLEQGRYVARTSAFVLVGATVLSWGGSQVLGLVGVAIGSLVGEMVGRGVLFSRVSRLLEIRISQLQDWTTLGKILLAAVISAICVVAASHYMVTDPDSVLSTIIATPFYIAAYLGLSYLFGLTWLIKSIMGRSDWRQSHTNL